MNSFNNDAPGRDENFEIGIRIDDSADADVPSLSAAATPVSSEPAATGEATGADVGERLVSDIHQVQRAIEALAEEFQAKLKYDEHKNRIIDGLHQELQTFREGLIRKQLHSVVTDVIKIVDDIRKFKSHYEQEPYTEETAARLLDFMDQIASDLEDLFSWEGIVPFTSSQNTFDTTRQRILRKIETNDPAKDKQVAQSLRPGYEWDGKVIRPEMVSVFVFTDATHEGPATDE